MTPATGIDTSALPCHSAAARMLGVGKARRSGVWIGALLALLVVACTEQLTVGPEGKFWGAGPPFMWPLRGTIASPFGDSRRIGGHLGIDLAARPGDPVAAAQSGRVAFAGLLPGYGTVVVLDHANHVSTVYAHLASTSLHDGTSVAQGETIGKLGAEGYLHYEVRRGKEAVDPMALYGVAPNPIPGGSVDVSSRLAEEGSAAVPVGSAPPSVELALPAPTTPTPPPTPTPAPRITPAPPLATLPPAATPTARILPTPRTAARALPPGEIPEPRATPFAVETPRPFVAEPEPLATPARELGTGESGGGASGVVLGVQLFAINVLYVPTKLAYSAVGAVTGGMALALSYNSSVAQGIWQRTMGGDYYVAAAHLKGEAPLHFIGEAAEGGETY